MFRILTAALFACLIGLSPAQARNHRAPAAKHDPMCNITMPCDFSREPTRAERLEARGRYVARQVGFGAPIKQRHSAPFVAPAKAVLAVPSARHFTANYYDVSPFGSHSQIGRPLRYIAGRLVCAVNVGAALAERGIRGTGSALAHSYDHWGHASSPVPGAVAVTDRRGGGHVAIVSRVEGNRVFVWNATGGVNGWHEIEYTNRHARYRVAG